MVPRPRDTACIIQRFSTVKTDNELKRREGKEPNEQEEKRHLKFGFLSDEEPVAEKNGRATGIIY